MKPTGLFIFVLAMAALAGCRTLQEPPPKPIRITSLKVSTEPFAAGVDVYAEVEGLLSSGSAQLIDPRQWREGYRLFVELSERTLVGMTGGEEPVPVSERIPIFTQGLAPGVYILNVNGVEAHFEIHEAGYVPMRARGNML